MALRVQIAVFDGFDEIDVFAPYEMLSGPNISVELTTLDGPAAVRSMRGIVVQADSRLDSCDGIIVPGGGWLNRADTGARAEVHTCCSSAPP